jgi:solute carrier family 24 (sodium/potassium/calcium exchanger), member 4
MAAGSSAPELATVIIGVFFAKDDIGVSGVIGSGGFDLLRSFHFISLFFLSAVFNIMFVISVCCLCSGTVSQLNWWPLVRDCTFYSLSILVMLVVICNEIISWPEALIMMIFYVVYCVALKFNTQLERIATPYILRLPIKLPSREEQSSLVTFKNAPDSSYTQGNLDAASPQQELNEPQPNDTSIYDPNSSWDPSAAWGEESAAPKAAPASNSWNNQSNDGWGDPSAGSQNYGYNQTEAETGIDEKPQGVSTTTAVQNSNDADYYKPKDQRPELPDPLIKPENPDMLTLANWYLVYPIHYMCRLTMVDVKQEKYKNWYPITFLISMVWISFYSYFMVWMITIIGFSLGIPDTVMGLTFVAAGVSVPDALSSIAVIKEGYGEHKTSASAYLCAINLN